MNNFLYKCNDLRMFLRTFRTEHAVGFYTVIIGEACLVVLSCGLVLANCLR